MKLNHLLFALCLAGWLLLAGQSSTAVQAAPQATYTVTTTADSGAGSLRQAVLDANSNAGADTINFDTGLSGQTITLTSGEIVINDSVSIDGSALANPVTIDGGSNDGRMFYINAPGGDITINSLRFINGRSNVGDPGNPGEDGGAIYANVSNSLTITESEFENNQAQSNGGAVYIYFDAGTIELTNNTFTNNSTLYAGGAVRTVSAQLTTLVGNTFVDNTANEGGAVWASGAGGATLTNNTFASNNGIGTVYLYRTLYLTNNTFLGNDGVTLRNAQAILHMRNNIIGSCDNAGGTISTNVNNWIVNNSCLPANGNPYLMPLADNGGQTQTAALMPFSGAVNAATSNCPTTDQRGTARGAAPCDLGAYEIQTTDHQTAQCHTGLVQGQTYAFGATGILMTVDTLGSLTQLCANLAQSNHPNATTGIQTGRHWTVTPTAGASNWSLTMSVPTTITLDGDDKLCRYTGTGIIWDCAVTSIDNTNNRITRSGITQLSPWAVGNDVGPTAVTNLHTQTNTPSQTTPVITSILATLLALFSGAALWLRRTV